MRSVYDVDFGWDKKATVFDRNVWSDRKILARNFEEAYSKAKRELTKEIQSGVKGLKIISIKRVMGVDIV